MPETLTEYLIKKFGGSEVSIEDYLPKKIIKSKLVNMVEAILEDSGIKQKAKETKEDYIAKMARAIAERKKSLGKDFLEGFIIEGINFIMTPVELERTTDQYFTDLGYVAIGIKKNISRAWSYTRGNSRVYVLIQRRPEYKTLVGIIHNAKS